MRIERNFYNKETGQFYGTFRLCHSNHGYYWGYIAMSQFNTSDNRPDLPNLFVDTDDVIFVPEHLNENNL